MIYRFTTLFTLFIIGFNLCLKAQEADSLSESSGMFFYPFAFYTPETKFAFGGGGIIFFRNELDKNSLPSKITPVAYFTTNRQYSLGVKSEIFFASNEYYTTAEIDFGKYSREFYGIGGNSPDLEFPEFKEKKIQATAALYKNINAFTRLGLLYEIEYHDIYDKLENPILLHESVLGSDGGLTSGLGVVAIYDTRDNSFYPTVGDFFEIEATYFNKTLGSEYDFNRYLINLRKYFAIFEDQVFAIQAYGSFISGNPPFYELSELGGQEVMRGYYEGRFRDEKYFSFQGEFRTKLFWRFGMVVYAGFGDVAGRFPDYKLTNLKYSYGVGGRFRIDPKEKLDVRVDIGFGKNTNGIYFGIEQAF